MMLVKTHAFNVVPRGRLVADVALIDTRVFLLGNILVNHFKVYHIMARRGLMTLGAIGRARAGMLKRRDRPLRRRVAGSAVLPEKSEVFVFRRVTARAVETGFERRDERVIFRQNLNARLI